MKVRIAQLAVSMDISANLNKVIASLLDSSPNEWVLFPEGMISGYYPEQETFLSQLDPHVIQQSIDTIEKIVQKKKVNCLIGSAMKLDEKWYNCTIFINSDKKVIYQKLNLSTLDRNHFDTGKELKVYDCDEVKFGIQMCRELAFPEQ
jgi:predicted amidohydrolase